MSALNVHAYIIASFAEDGDIKPVWYGLEATEQIRIGEVVTTKFCCHCGIDYYVFLCRAECQGEAPLLELRYYVRDRGWKLFRVLE